MVQTGYQSTYSPTTRDSPTGFPVLPRGLLGPCERDMGLAAARSGMPSMASNYPRVAKRSGLATTLYGEDAREEDESDDECLAPLAHHY